MNQKISQLLMVCLASLFVVFDVSAAIRNQKSSAEPLRVLVDASKDGGLWWFPQAPPNFNPNEPHQGKQLADFMRALGWKVTELGRGQVITFEKLRDFDLVIRPAAYSPYSHEEALAYQQSVAAGTRVLLSGLGKESDAIAEIFGLRWSTRSRYGPIKQWIPHALTAKIECCELSWTTIQNPPPGAVALAWMNQGSTNPVLGYLPYGNGAVVFIGQALIGPAPGRLFAEDLIKSVGRYTPEELARLPMAAAVVKDESPDLGPRLLRPLPEELLPQPDSGIWRFEWEGVPGAKNYEVVVLGPGAAFPLVRAVTRTSHYVRNSRDGYIIDSNRRGWSWRVRAQYQDGTWGPWSRIRSFDVKSRAPKSTS